MRGIHGLALALALLAGCAHQEFSEPPMTAAEMPGTLALAGLVAKPDGYHRWYDGGRGTDVRRMVMSGNGQFAIVVYVATVGAYVLPERSTRSWIGLVLSDDAETSWGASGGLGGTTGWQAVDLRGQPCVGVNKETNWHPEAGGGRSGTRGMLVAVYCKAGSAPMQAADAARVAAALQMKT